MPVAPAPRNDTPAGRTVRGQIVYHGLLALAVFLLYGYSSARVIDLSVADLGRHIKNGELILETGAIPRTNLFSYTHPDAPFVNHHWGAGIIYYCVHAYTGFAGLRLLNMALVLTSVGLLFALAWRWTRCELAVLAAILAEPLIGGRSEVRPEYFSILFVAVFFVLLWQYRQGVLSGRWLWFLPAAEILWVNLHILFPLGPLLIAIFLVEELLPNLRGLADRRWPRVRLLVALVASCTLVTLLNPWGLEGAAYPLMIFRNYGYVITENLPTWRHLHQFPEGYHFVFVFALTFLGICLTLLAPERRDRRLALVLPTLLFALLAWRYGRGIAMFGFFVLAALPLLWDRVKVLQFTEGLQKRSAVLLLCGVAVFSFAVRPEAWMFRPASGLGLAKGNLDGLEFFRDHHLRGPIFNSYNVGNYLIYGLYPDERVFVDGRPEAYPDAFFHESLLPLLETANEDHWESLQKKYDFNVLVLHTPEVQGQLGYTFFFANRCKDPLWAPVFYDRYVIILLRRTPQNKPIIDRYEVDWRL